MNTFTSQHIIQGGVAIFAQANCFSRSLNNTFLIFVLFTTTAQLYRIIFEIIKLESKNKTYRFIISNLK